MTAHDAKLSVERLLREPRLSPADIAECQRLVTEYRLGGDLLAVELRRLERAELCQRMEGAWPR